MNIRGTVTDSRGQGPNENDNPAMRPPSDSPPTGGNDKLVEVLKKHWTKILAGIVLLILIGVEVSTWSRPSIKTFSASSLNVKRGEKVKLTWETGKANSVTLNGAKVALSGSTEMTPTKTPYSYELRAKNDYGGSHKRIVVTVIPAAVPTVKFWVEPQQVEKNETAVLNWETTGATDVKINDGKVDLSGHQEVKASATQTYTLVAQNEDGKKAESVSLKVVPTPEPDDANVHMNFKTTRNTVRPGEDATLSWDTGAVKDVELRHGGQPPEIVTPKGELKVTPSGTTIYTLTGYPPTGPPIIRIVSIRVISVSELPGKTQEDATSAQGDGKPRITFGAEANSIQQGQPTELIWKAAPFSTGGAAVEAEVVEVVGFTYVLKIKAKEYAVTADIHTNKDSNIGSGDVVTVRVDNGRVLEIKR